MKPVYEYENKWHKYFVVLFILFLLKGIENILENEKMFFHKNVLEYFTIFSLLFLLFFTKVKNEIFFIEKMKTNKQYRNRLLIIIVVVFVFSFLSYCYI